MASSSGQGGTPAFFTVENTHFFNANGINWTPALVPAGQALAALSLTVIASDPANSITDADGTVVTGLPVSYSASWGATNGGTIVGPQIIAPGPTGRILITFVCR